MRVHKDSYWTTVTLVFAQKLDPSTRPLPRRIRRPRPEFAEWPGSLHSSASPRRGTKRKAVDSAGLSLIGFVAPGRNSQRSLEACTRPRHLVEHLLGQIFVASQAPESLETATT